MGEKDEHGAVDPYGADRDGEGDTEARPAEVDVTGLGKGGGIDPDASDFDYLGPDPNDPESGEAWGPLDLEPPSEPDRAEDPETLSSWERVTPKVQHDYSVGFPANKGLRALMQHEAEREARMKPIREAFIKEQKKRGKT